MKRNTTKKAATALVAATLACSLAPVTAFARVGSTRTNAQQPGLAAQLGVRAGLGQQLGLAFGAQQFGGLGQQTNFAFGTQRAAGLGQQLGGAFGVGQDVRTITGPGTYALGGIMQGVVRFNPGAGNFTLVMDKGSFGNANGPTIEFANGNAGQQAPTSGNAGQQAPTSGNVQPGQQAGSGTVGSTSTVGAIVTGTTTNSAVKLAADYSAATLITVTDDNSNIKITEAGTYIITGAASSGNVVVKKGTTGVVLVLQDLDLTSTTGATLSVNKGAEAQIVVVGTVTLTDAENPADETSADADVADAYDGAVIKVKAGAAASITGDGTLVVNGNAKNGIKVGGDDADGFGSLVIDGATINITAANDGINANYDLAILSGNLTVSAGDDAIHADRVLTIGDEATHTGPTVNVAKSYEGIEGTVVNICGGSVTVNATDDAINAANSDGTYASLGYSINMTGGSVVSNSRADGFDSNGNVNLVAGSATISSANNGGDAGIDYDGQLYVSGEFELNNKSGVAGPDGMGTGGQPGQMGGGMGGFGNQKGQPGGMGGQTGGAMGGRQQAGGNMGGMR